MGKKLTHQSISVGKGRRWVSIGHNEDDNLQNPYGNVYRADDLWWLQSDGDSTLEYFASSDNNDDDAFYRSELGFYMYDSHYQSDEGWIKRDWIWDLVILWIVKISKK